jgi:hypothetical protein
MTAADRQQVESKLRRAMGGAVHVFVNGPYADGFYFAGALDSFDKPGLGICAKGKNARELIAEINSSK